MAVQRQQPQQGQQGQQGQEQAPASGQSSISASFEKGMITDMDDTFMPQGSYFSAVNATPTLPDGTMGGISTEPWNVLFLNKAPYIFIGREYMAEGQWITFWTDNTHSEIGVYTETTGAYTVLINDTATIAAGLPGMGFNTSHLITAKVRRGYDCGWNVYWSDDQLNPDRSFNTATTPFNTADPNLVPNPWFQTVTHPTPGCNVYTNINLLNTQQLLLELQYSTPCLTLVKSNQSGILKNGQYQCCIAYTINGYKATDYIAVSNIMPIWSHIGQGGALTLNMTNLETVTYREMELVVISMVGEQVVAKRYGTYDTTQSTVVIDNILDSMVTIPLEQIPLSTPSIVSSDAIYGLNNYLVRVGPTYRPDFNYQPLANQIQAHWVCVEYPDTYYHDGGINGFAMNVAYMRGEVYAFYLQWEYPTGDFSAAYPLIGPTAGAFATGGFSMGGPSVGDGGVTICSGIFNTYTSIETYPSSQSSVWNSGIAGHPEWDVCGQPIRWFRFPDQATFSGIPGQMISHFWNYGTPSAPSMTIRVMGVYFDNIHAPVDNNGNVIPTQGYRILRATRDGNTSVVAKGMVNHMRGYTNADGTTGVYQNYPFDSLHKDRFLTSNQTIGTIGGIVDGYGGNELSQVFSNLVSFHSPETVFQKNFLGIGQLNLVMGVSGIATGSFDTPFKHPMFKLVTDLTSSFAAVIGGLAVLLDIARAATGGGGANLTLAATSDLPATTELGMVTFPDGPVGALGTIAYGAGVVLSAAIATLLAPIEGRITQQQIMNIINGMVPGVQYARQYDAHGYYTNPIWTGRSVNSVTDYDYILGQLQSFADMTVNNLYRNDYVAVELSANIPDFPAPYNYTGLPAGSNAVWQGFGMVTPGCDDSLFTLGQGPASPYAPGQRSSLGPFGSPIISWYGSYEVPLASQYGQVDSPKQVPISCTLSSAIPNNASGTFTSPVLFGGDTYINRYTEKNPFLYFNDWLYDVPEDYRYDYTQYENVPYPRYWVRNTKIYYDFWQQASANWHLDELGSTAGQFWVKNGYFYLFNNGIRDFYVESTINVAYRDYGNSVPEQFYNPYGFTDVSQLFRSDYMKLPANFYKYDYSLSANRFWNQWLSWAQCLRRDYDPILAYSCFSYYPRRLNYSLPQSEELVADNWRIFLANNYKDFPSQVTGVEAYSNTGALFMQKDQPPLQIAGVETLPSSSGTDFTTGTGALFHQQLQAVSNAGKALQFGSCQGRYGVINTPYGVFWISQRTGKIMQYAPNKTFFNQGEAVIDITVYGKKFWFSQYLPSKLLQQFPTYPLSDNPVAGVGVQLSYDNVMELLYITKRDFVAKQGVTWNGTNWIYTLPGVCPAGYNTVLTPTGLCSCQLISNLAIHIPCSTITIEVMLGDPAYFTDASWTISYDPKNKRFISYHIWISGLMLSGELHITTSAPDGQSLWMHNTDTGGFCNYYGKQSYFEIEAPANSGIDVTNIESIEYVLNSFRYLPNQTDKFNLYADTFNYCQIFNEEQSTLPTNLVERPWNNPFLAISYPFVTGIGNNVLFTKVENKFRFSNIRDYTQNRFQFGVGVQQMKVTSPNGYQWTPSAIYFDYFKNSLELKKVRFRANHILLRKSDISVNSLTLQTIKASITKSFR